MTQLVDWTRARDRVLVMGILNVTPDSFYDGEGSASPTCSIERGLQMEADGADIVDVGGESTRPGSKPISLQEEMDRVLPVIEGIRERRDITLSVDTTKAEVAKEALSLGATIVNDISALRFDRAMGKTLATSGAFVVLMHMLGTPETMQQDPTYDDVVEQIRSFLEQRIRVAVDVGIDLDRIFIDPGIGFGKRLHDNLAVLRNLRHIATLGPPLVIGLSRKSFLGEILGVSANERLEATIAANTAAIMHGARIIRVHDVQEGRRTADVAFCLREDAC
jgi:dihydropteroate synthase